MCSKYTVMIWRRTYIVLSTRTKVWQEFYFKVISNYWTGSLYWITVMNCNLLYYLHPIRCACGSLVCGFSLDKLLTAILGNKTCAYAVFRSRVPKRGNSICHIIGYCICSHSARTMSFASEYSLLVVLHMLACHCLLMNEFILCVTSVLCIYITFVSMQWVNKL